MDNFWASVEHFTNMVQVLYERVIGHCLYYFLLLASIGHLQFVITKWPQRLMKHDGQEVLSFISGALFLYGAHVLNQEARKKQ